MKSSLKIGVVKGIKIQVHWTFLLLIAWIVLVEVSRGGTLEAVVWNIIFIMALFTCVVLHELGHGLAAARYGIATRQITLLPIGGVASLEDMPEEPREELVVAIAGPAVNVVIAALLSLVVPLQNYMAQDPEQLEILLGSINAENFLFFLLSANIMLVLFNLLPAFPMDGGRVLRALLSMKMGRVRATQLAARLGQMVALLFFFVGLFFNPILLLIAIFVYFGAQSENVMVQQLTLLRDYTVRDAMMTDITPLKPDDSLDSVVDKILSGAERDFLVMDDGQVTGIVYQADLIPLFKKKQTGARVGDIMDRNVNSVSVSEDLTEVYRKIQSSRKSFFPVKDGERLVGAIDMNNISEFMIFRAYRDF